MMMQALEVYRSQFRPSKYLNEPYVMVGYNAFVAETDDEAMLLASSAQQSFINNRMGRPSQLPAPKANLLSQLDSTETAIVRQTLAASAIGSPATVRQQIKEFVALTQADELIVASAIYNHEARLHSYELLAQIRDED